MLRELFTELLRDKANVRHIADMTTGADICYYTGDTHPPAGRWAPDLVLRNENGPVRLAELTRGARPLLLDLTGDGALAEGLAGAHDRVDAVTAHADAAPATALLLRPDGYVAWASSAPRPDRAVRHAALGRWFGAAA
ncbi:aromatic-ring hydroxylase C-terminal domain-containing protein [Actinophytocola algeriensis]|uniref:Uncharacterized protein n=1 Tax=Actinophytocola algeriensis TaxID=1768010 RepID=A0A7W7Q9D0_9PSEU|nr:hypothetical protein [Actinophytocola algeriensis]MBB4909397.1 hypothetical protein [Actinophytocola algeriensis]MBE1475387.1 hypothetical protein [Actinophytocola algeriensis]